MIARRLLLAGLLAGAARAGRGATDSERIAVGAIRWDAWQGGSTVTRAVERSLSPSRFRDRLPFFARVEADRVEIDAADLRLMDQEIALALRAGLSFWGFVAYPPDDPMARGLRLYLASQARRGLRFCLIAELARWDAAGDGGPSAPAWHVELLRHPDAQRVDDGRPLYVLGFLSDRLIAARWGGPAGLRAAVERFRARAEAAGAGNPFIVIMAPRPAGARYAEMLGGDAIGAYAIEEGRVAAPFAALAADAERRWSADAGTGHAVVPTVMTGWDRRPRVENPVPWEPWQQPGRGAERYYERPAPQELTEHLRRGISWVAAQPGRAARVALIYAWNEHDEGGWLVPTLPYDTSRIEAVRAALCGADRRAAGPGCD